MNIESEIMALAASIFTEDSLAECERRLEAAGCADLVVPTAAISATGARMHKGQDWRDLVVVGVAKRISPGDKANARISAVSYAIEALVEKT